MGKPKLDIFYWHTKNFSELHNRFEKEPGTGRTGDFATSIIARRREKGKWDFQPEEKISQALLAKIENKKVESRQNTTFCNINSHERNKISQRSEKKGRVKK